MTKMSTHDKPKAGRNPNNLRSSKSPITTPAPARIHNRFKESSHLPSSDSASTKSIPDGSPSSDTEESPSIDREKDKEKDKRIESLEKEIRTMEEEFERELSVLLEKLTGEKETSQFWQQKHSSLNQTFLKTDTEFRLLKQEVGSWERNKEERERDIKTRISSLMLDRDAFREAYNEAMGELRGKEDEVRALRESVRGLKSWVSLSGRGVEQVTDESVGEMARRLGNGVQNWCIMHFRRCRIDPSKASPGTHERLLSLIPTYESLASTSKIYLIQSLISRLLVEHIFSAYFVGLEKEHAEELEKVEKYLESVGTKESLNSWRSTTLSIFRKSPDSLATTTTAITESVVEEVNTLMSSIGDIPPTESRDQALRNLISNAVDLSRLLRVQKANFSVVMEHIEGHQVTMFDSDLMEDIGGEDEDGLEGREVRCVAFFGVVKWGDENGERGHLRNVVAKMRVLCAPD